MMSNISGIYLASSTSDEPHTDDLGFNFLFLKTLWIIEFSSNSLLELLPLSASLQQENAVSAVSDQVYKGSDMYRQIE